MSDMVVGVKTFTVRDLDRNPASVLAAADRDGVACVRSRTGRRYSLRPETNTAPRVDWAAFASRRRAALETRNLPHIDRSSAREIDRLLAGD